MQIKTIGANANGQVTLGTKYAGQSVAIEEIEPGVWLVKLGDFIPHNEKWLHEPPPLINWIARWIGRKPMTMPSRI
jgi:hypothetical protein